MRGFLSSGRCRAALGILTLIAASSPAFGVQTFMLGGGWEADVPDGEVVSIVGDGIFNDPVLGDFLALEISKDFIDPPGLLGVFPSNLIDFRQVDSDANTIPRIVIFDEAVSNQTGVAWTDYHYALLDGGQSWFNVPLSDFDPSPFTNKTFSDNHGFGDPDKATDIDIDGGVVPAGTSFFPAGNNGEIVIDVALDGSGNVSFTLKQFPTPEPATMLLLAGGGALLLARRRR